MWQRVIVAKSQYYPYIGVYMYRTYMVYSSRLGKATDLSAIEQGDIGQDPAAAAFASRLFAVV